MKRTLRTVGIVCIVVAGLVLIRYFWRGTVSTPIADVKSAVDEDVYKTDADDEEAMHPLMIEAMRNVEYPGSPLSVVETLSPTRTYARYIVSYQSEGLTIFGLLTVPIGQVPEGGFPAIVFNHGYIPPEEYRSTERYVAYVDGFASAGYVVFKPDYRGHGASEGDPEGAYFSPAYTTDVLNAVSSLQTRADVDPDRIGMWGHSLGGHIAIRAMVVSEAIGAGVVWGGVVGSYQDMQDYWWGRRTSDWQPSVRERNAHRPSRRELTEMHGEPDDDSDFWRSISPVFFVEDISGPVQIHHGTADETVPHELSKSLHDALVAAGKSSELYLYPGGDHNLSNPAFELAMERSVTFFDTYLK